MKYAKQSKQLAFTNKLKARLQNFTETTDIDLTGTNAYIESWEERVIETLIDFNSKKPYQRRVIKNKISAKAKQYKKSMNKAFKRLVKIWTSTAKIMGIARRIRSNTKQFIKYRKKWYRQMQHDKKHAFNEFLDKLSQGGMKGIWNYFNSYQKKKRKNFI